MAGCEARFGGPQRFKGVVPAVRLANLAQRVAQHRLELAGRDWATTQLLEERWTQIEAALLRRMGVEHSHAYAKLVNRQLDRGLEIGVVGDHDRYLAVLAKGIEQHVRGQVHIRALLLGLEDADRFRSERARFHQRHMHRPRLVLAIVDREARDRFECSEVRRLPLGLLKVRWPVFNPRREIPDSVDLVPRKYLPEQRGQVQPLVGLPLQRSVEEVEGVDVVVGLHEGGDYRDGLGGLAGGCGWSSWNASATSAASSSRGA